MKKQKKPRSYLVKDLFPDIVNDKYYLNEMDGHGRSLNPSLSLSELDDLNLRHLTYRTDCPIDIYREILTRCVNGDQLDDSFLFALLDVPNVYLDELKIKIVDYCDSIKHEASRANIRKFGNIFKYRWDDFSEWNE